LGLVATTALCSLAARAPTRLLMASSLVAFSFLTPWETRVGGPGATGALGWTVPAEGDTPLVVGVGPVTPWCGVVLLICGRTAVGMLH